MTDTPEDIKPQDQPVDDTGGAVPPMPSVEQELADVRAQLDVLQDKLLRTTADYQNYVRRAQQNVDAAREQTIRDLIKALVPVLDHFDSALAVDTEKTTAQSLYAGLKIVHEELLKALSKFGVERIDVKPGDEFDPNHHYALMRQKVEGVDAGRIAAQFQPAYLIEGKTLRPAQVSVAE